MRRSSASPILLGRELVVLAAAQPALGDDDGAEAVDEALAIARRTGALVIIHDMRLLLGHREPAEELGLTPREREVLVLLQAGDTNAQIAHQLDVSPATVRKHLEHIYAKLGVSTRTAAAGRMRDAAVEPGPSRTQ